MHLRRIYGCLPLFLAGLFLAGAFLSSAKAQSCPSHGLAVQVLGSGGPDFRDKRASSSYLIWKEGRALVLIDAGGGSALRFGQSGAAMSQLQVILLTHLHADHTSDLPALIHSSRFEDRKLPLPVFGPPAGQSFPSTTEFFDDLFGKAHGAWRYMSGVMDDGQPYRLEPHDVVAGDVPVQVFQNENFTVDAVRTDHGRAPALAWRVEIGGKRIVFSGDTGGHGEGLPRLAKDADLFVAHNATSRLSNPATIAILMPPLVIGQIAAQAHVKRLVLSHRMADTLGKKHEAATRADIRETYRGPLDFASDLQCFVLR
ncbi:MAG TPA: MBL fold metallo-hydrolase [Candidatus Aquilonibacter sp.]|nr:MBL fold metallo-hydrolase [Candidatus Aquilonibacter sp.]